VRAAAAVIPRLPAGRYVLSNTLARHMKAHIHARLPAESGGFFFHCHGASMMEREICFTGRYSPVETALMRMMLDPGMTFFDVGANIGYFSLLAAHLVGPGGRVLALEPDPRTFPRLRGNVQLNEIPQLEVIEVAAAEARGRATLHGHSERSGNHGTSQLGAGRPGDPRYEVVTESLDDLRSERQIDRVHLAKIDVEGAELRVLRGMTRGLAQGAYERIMLELHPRAEDFDYPVLRDLLMGHGYQVMRLKGENVRRLTYARTLHAHAVLERNAELEAADLWPHQLWLAPGVAAPV
jgi:FkbM family methyltransferase